MLELYGWDVGMSTLAVVLLIAGAVVIGGASYFIGDVTAGFEGILTGLAALVGGYLGSEAFGTLSTWGPADEGLYIVPAVLGGIVLGGLVDAITRFATEGSYVHQVGRI